MSEELKCDSCKGLVPDEAFTILCFECMDAIQFLLNTCKLNQKCLTEGLPYSEDDVKVLALTSRKARRIVHKYACNKNKCCDECLLLSKTLERFFYNKITEE